MGKEPTDKSMMSRIAWALVLWVSSTLEEAEREAVVGDLAESGERDGKAVANVLGLVIRRHAGVLTDWRLWVAVGIVILPVSFALSVVAQTAAGEGAVYTWMYVNNWEWSLTKSAGFWYVLGDAGMQLAIAGLLLACWSWSTGFVLGRLPKTILGTSRIALLLLLTACQLSDAPRHFTQFLMHLYGVPPVPSLPDPNAPVTAIVFYRVFFPWIILASLVFLPAIWGMRQGHQISILGRKLRFVLVTVAAISLITMLVQVPGFGLVLGASGREWFWHNRNALRILPVLACWPTLYLIPMGVWLHRHYKAAPA